MKRDNKITICVSGAAETGHCGLDAHEEGINLGREIARQGAILMTGATSGFPSWAAQGAKEEHGQSIGLSPAATLKEHITTYKLPSDNMDLIIYTGFGFPGRDLLLVRSAEAIIIGCGRIGTIHEFTIAFEEDKPIGILDGEWPTGNVIRDIVEHGNRPNAKIIFDKDPKSLVAKIIEMVKKDRLASGNPS